MLLNGDFGCLDCPGLYAYCYESPTVRKYYFLRAPNWKRGTLLLTLQLQLALVLFQKCSQIPRNFQQPNPLLVIQRDRESSQPVHPHSPGGRCGTAAARRCSRRQQIKCRAISLSRRVVQSVATGVSRGAARIGPGAVYTERLPPRKRAPPLAENSIPSFSTGWFTSIPTKTPPTKSSPCTCTRTNARILTTISTA